jgi:hypothetical protein
MSTELPQHDWGDADIDNFESRSEELESDLTMDELITISQALVDRSTIIYTNGEDKKLMKPIHSASRKIDKLIRIRNERDREDSRLE